MRDIKLLSETARAIWNNGGSVRGVRTGASGVEIYAGDKRLNTQAVIDLLADGWLTSVDKHNARMDQLPPFAATV